VEEQVCSDLLGICERVIDETAEGLEQARQLAREEIESGGEQEQVRDRAVVDGYILQQLEALWIEQGGIAAAVLARIKAGDTDW
jgi:hypothetical protein